MNQSQLEQLKATIKTSPILSTPERAEWLALLELMNDKQLGELQGILENRVEGIGDRVESTTKPEVKVSAPAVAQNTSFSQKPQGKQEVNLDYGKLGTQRTPGTASLASFGQTTSPQQPVQKQAPMQPDAQIPKLSHIMNLPNSFTGRAKPLEDIAVKTQLSRQPVSSDAFIKKMKRTVEEIELPAGIQEQLLEQAPTKTTQAVPAAPAAPKAPVAPKPPAPPQTDNRQITETEPTKQEEEKYSGLRKDMSAEVKAILEAKNNQVRPVSSGFQPVPQPVKTEMVTPETADIKPVLVEMAKTVTKPLAEPPFNQVNDLAVLEPSSLDLYDFNSIVKKVRALISKFGYHEIKFGLEQSPLYKAYLKTGLELLTNQGNFEELANENGSNGYLTRAQFEETADLLRQIQAG